MDGSNNKSGASVADSISDLIEPVRLKLSAFNPGAEYESRQITFALQKAIKNGRIKGVALMPDLNRFSARVEGDNYLLLVNLACKTFVDLILLPTFPTKKRISKHQKEFAGNLESEIYHLENGEEAFSGS